MAEQNNLYRMTEQPQYNQNTQSYNNQGKYDNNGQNYNNNQDYNNNEKYNNQQDLEKPNQIQPEAVKTSFNDIPFAIFFILVFAGFVAVSAIVLNSLRTSLNVGSSIYDSKSFTLNTNTSILFAFIVAVGIILSAGIVVYARLYPRFFITTGLILNIIFGLGTCIYYFVSKYYSAAIVFLVITLLSAWSYWTCRGRIPFSATILEIVIDVMKKYPSTLITSFIGILASGFFGIWFSIVIVGTYVKYEQGSKLIGILVFVFFAGYYITEVIKNVIHVVISGIYGSWYYLSATTPEKNPGLSSFKRAMTYCFGSICFGSLIVSIIQLIQAVVHLAKNNAMQSGDYCAGCGLLVLDVILQFINWMVSYFNQYAYCYIALYGKNYIRSAKDTFELMKFKGIDALVNDCFIGTALNMYSLLVGYIVALLAYFYLKFTKPAYNDDGGFYGPVVAFSFLISGQITRVSLVVIESGVSTFFVSLAKDPEVLRDNDRQRFDEIFANYPQVLEKLYGNA